MQEEQKKRTEIGCGIDDLHENVNRDTDGAENGDSSRDREMDRRIWMYAALAALEPEDVEAFLSRIPEETWNEERVEHMVSGLECDNGHDGEEKDRISIQRIRKRVQQRIAENLKENAENIQGNITKDGKWQNNGEQQDIGDFRRNQAGECITKTANRKRVRRNHFPWRKLAGVAAVAVLALLVWQKDTVYAGLKRMLRLVPGVTVYEENEAVWYTLVPEQKSFSWQGWSYELQEGYVQRMPDQDGLTNRGRLVIRLTAQKERLSAAESEQQASTGDTADTQENVQENTQQESEMADDSYFVDNRIYRRKKDSQDAWEPLADGGSGFGTEQTEDDVAGPKKVVIGKENLRMDDFSTEDEYCFGTAGGDGLRFTLQEPACEAVLEAGTVENTSGAGTENGAAKGADKSSDEGEAGSEKNRTEFRLAVTEKQTDDSLLISYYPYTGRQDMTVQLPYFPTYETLPTFMDNSVDVRPWMAYGEEKVYADGWGKETDRYSDLVTTRFPAMNADEGTLHVPYVQMDEQSSPVTVTLEEGQEAMELGQALDFEHAQVRLDRLAKLSEEECTRLVGAKIDDDTSAWLLKLTVLQESDGWLLQKLSVQVDRYPYSTVLPVFTDGKLTGMLLFLDTGNSYREGASIAESNVKASTKVDSTSVTESSEESVTEFRRNAKSSRTPAAIQLKIGNPSYLYHCDFVLGPIRK